MSDTKRVRMPKREGALMARLSAKEQEVYEAQACARDLYRARRPVTDFARHVYTDPAINVEFQLMTAQLAEMEDTLRLREAELKELKAQLAKEKEVGKSGGEKKDGQGGGAKKEAGAGAGAGATVVEEVKGLLQRCQQLEQENEELAASASAVKVAQLQSEKAIAEAYAGDLKAMLQQAYDYIEQLEEYRETSAHKIYALEMAVQSAAEVSFVRGGEWGGEGTDTAVTGKIGQGEGGQGEGQEVSQSGDVDGWGDSSWGAGGEGGNRGSAGWADGDAVMGGEAAVGEEGEGGDHDRGSSHHVMDVTSSEGRDGGTPTSGGGQEAEESEREGGGIKGTEAEKEPVNEDL